MNIAVIGGTGFVGQYLIKDLSQNPENKIKVLSRGIKKNLYIPINKFPGVEIKEGVDISDYPELLKHLSGNDIVFNLAGLVSFLQKDKSKLLEINYKGAINVLRACEKLDVKKLIHLSSTASLGFGKNIINEECNFNWEKYKKCAYSISKSLANEEILKSRCNAIVIYPSLILGAGDITNSLKIVKAIKDRKIPFITPGSNSIIDVRDLSRALNLLIKIENPEKSYIVSSHYLTYKELYSEIANVVKVKAPKIHISKSAIHILKFLALFLEKIIKNPPITYENIFMSFQKRHHSNDRIKKLGFSPRYSISETINEINNWIITL